MESSTDDLTLEQTSGFEVDEISPRRLTRDAVALSVRADRIDGALVGERVGQQSDLAMIEVGAPEELQRFTELRHLPDQVVLELLDRTPQDLEVVEQEVRRIEAVRLCV